jgi:CPA2 family monovalent cation:H+ antiporter-2
MQLMHEITPIFFDLGIILCMAGIMSFIFKKIKQPIVLAYLMAGIIVGPFTPPHAFVTATNTIHMLANLGIVFMLFSLGLEFSFKRLLHVGWDALLIAVVVFAFVMSISFWVTRQLSWDVSNALFISSALSISSTMMIVKVLEEMNLMQKQFNELLLSILIIEDIFAILLISLLPNIAQSMRIDLILFKQVFKVILLLALWGTLGYYIVVKCLVPLARQARDENIFIFVIGLCFLMVFLMKYLGFSPGLGAFLVGTVLADTQIEIRVKHLIYPLRDLFAAVFFVTVGMLIDVSILPKIWPYILLLTAVFIVSKNLATSALICILRKNKREAIQVGCSLTQIGEFSFIIISMGNQLHLLTSDVYPLVTGIAALTTFVAPYIIKFGQYLKNRQPYLKS